MHVEPGQQGERAVADVFVLAVLVTGLPIGTPQEALDTACTVHLAGLGHEPDS